jgi:hypothetical protein
MLVVTLLITIGLPSFLCRELEDRSRDVFSACPYYWMVSLLALSLTLCTVLVWPYTGTQAVGLFVFACIAYGIPHLVTKHVFFLWETPNDTGSVPKDIGQQWTLCAPFEKRVLAHLAQNRFLTTANKEIFSLIQKGLAQMAPNPRLSNDRPEVRKFIQERSHEEKVFEGARDSGSQLWEQGIWTIKLGLTGFGTLVLFTQEQFRPVILAALAPALPVLLKLPFDLDAAKILAAFAHKGKA